MTAIERVMHRYKALRTRLEQAEELKPHSSIRCVKCDGTGVKQVSKYLGICPECRGSGMKVQSRP